MPSANYTDLSHDRVDAHALHALLLGRARAPEHRHVETAATFAAVWGAASGALGAHPRIL